jgi:CBS domain-containing protein
MVTSRPATEFPDRFLAAGSYDDEDLEPSVTFMTPNPISISGTASLAEAVGILSSGNKISGLPVVDDERRLW